MQPDAAVTRKGRGKSTNAPRLLKIGHLRWNFTMSRSHLQSFSLLVDLQLKLGIRSEFGF
jgi:hypothetical protein